MFLTHAATITTLAMTYCDLLLTFPPGDHAVLTIRPTLLRIRALHQQLPPFTVPSRLNLRLSHHLENTPPTRFQLLKNPIHLLQASIRRLWVEKVDAGHHERVDHRKDDVGLVPDVVERNRGDHDDQEIEDPIRRRAQCVGRRADPKGHDFGWVQPRHAQPAHGEKGVEHKQKDHNGDLTGFVVLERIHPGQNRHRGGLAHRAEEHQLATAYALDEEDGGPRGDEVLGAVQCGQEQRQEVRHAKVGVNHGQIVRHQVDARNLLKHLVEVREQRPVEIAPILAVARRDEQIAKRTLGHFKHRVLDLVEFGHDELVRDGLVGKRGEDFLRLILAALEDQPAGGLGQAPDHREDEDAKHDLEGQGEPPGDGPIGKREAQIDPVTDHDAARDQRALDHDELAALVRVRRLGLPGGYRRGVSSVAQARDDAADDQVRQRGCGGLEDGADDHDGGAQHDHSLAAQGVAQKDGQDGAEETAEVVGGGGDALDGGALRGFGGGEVGGRGVDFGELAEEGRHGQDATENALVCEEEYDRL